MQQKPKPIITVGEARKLLGGIAKELTNQELEKLIADLEQMLRLVFRDFSVHKSRMVDLK